MLDGVFSVVVMLVAVGLVIILAYFTTIIIAKKSNGLLRNPAVKVLERSTIGLQVNITIIQISTKVYILANQGKQMTVLDTIDADEWHQNRQRMLDLSTNTVDQLPKPMEYLLNKIKWAEMNFIRKKR